MIVDIFKTHLLHCVKYIQYGIIRQADGLNGCDFSKWKKPTVVFYAGYLMAPPERHTKQHFRVLDEDFKL